MQATVDCFYPPGQVSPLLIEGIFRQIIKVAITKQATVDCFYPPGQVSVLLKEGIFSTARNARPTAIPYTSADFGCDFSVSGSF